MSKSKKRQPKTIDELVKGYEEFAKTNKTRTVTKKQFDNALSKVVKPKSNSKRD